MSGKVLNNSREGDINEDAEIGAFSSQLVLFVV